MTKRVAVVCLVGDFRNSLGQFDDWRDGVGAGPLDYDSEIVAVAVAARIGMPSAAAGDKSGTR